MATESEVKATNRFFSVSVDRFFFAADIPMDPLVRTQFRMGFGGVDRTMKEWAELYSLFIASGGGK